MNDSRGGFEDLRALLAPLQETEHFYRGSQEKVAKIVQCGETIEEEAIRKGGLKFLRPIHYRAPDSPLDCTLRELIPLSRRSD